MYGDSISTFAGVTPPDGMFYAGAVCTRTGVQRVEDTWWMQVIAALGGVLERNSAWAGACVAGDAPTAGSAPNRAAALGQPDLILVYLGLNDAALGVPLAEFSQAYDRMLANLRVCCPQAEIWCGQLLRPEQPDESQPRFFNAEAFLPLEAFNGALAESAKRHGVHLAEAVGSSAYDAPDGVHPSRAGMRTLAALFLRAMGAA